jgi:hypothetical protein
LIELKQLVQDVLKGFSLDLKTRQQLVHQLVLHYGLWDYIGPDFSSTALYHLAAFENMPEQGRDAVVIGVIGENLHIRIFDRAGAKILDAQEATLLKTATAGNVTKAAEHISFLKHLMQPDRPFERLIESRFQEALTKAATLVGIKLPLGYFREFAQLKEKGKACFKICPPAEHARVIDHPFALYSNVRITRVRCWIEGVKTKQFVHVGLVHKGEEFIRASDRSLVPVIHEKVSGSFEYEWEKVSWDKQHSYINNPDKALKHGSDCELGIVRLDGEDVEYLKMIGPFAEWEITLSDEANVELDRTIITAIHMDFHIIADELKEVAS